MVSQKIKKILTGPIFSKKIDPFIIVLFAFSGAFIGTSFGQKVPLWQTLFITIPIILVLILILKIIGTKWRKKKVIDENENY